MALPPCRENEYLFTEDANFRSHVNSDGSRTSRNDHTKGREDGEDTQRHSDVGVVTTSSSSAKQFIPVDKERVNVRSGEESRNGYAV